MATLKYIKAILEDEYGIEIMKRGKRYYLYTSHRKKQISKGMTPEEFKIWYLGFKAREKVRKRRRR